MRYFTLDLKDHLSFGGGDRRLELAEGAAAGLALEVASVFAVEGWAPIGYEAGQLDGLQHPAMPETADAVSLACAVVKRVV